jgi:hypothetical protein
LAHLPVAIVECSLDCRVDVVPVEWREREDRSASNGGDVGASVQDRGEPTLITDRSE